ncbi:MAG: tRNA epoxyqueuosine(34) reductase QueG, partial [Eubacteriaceae bacterium]|nr:tRNA epoxyqueuosine(34) reductase QueG [Eubacteriaceae bacterium]
ENFQTEAGKLSKKYGLDLIGFTDAEAKTFFKDIYRERAEAGRLCGIDKTDFLVRLRPHGVWEECRGILGAALSYYKEDCCARGTGNGRFSRVARGTDYHKVLKGKMELVMQELSISFPELEYKVFVDTGDLSDRVIAYECGLGFYGKNNFIIHPKQGSYIFLGHILVNIPLEKSARPLAESCGDCSLCISACPTGALIGNKKLDANRCISYLTQKKGILTRWERKAIGVHIYGCDICQEVCPWNKALEETLETAFDYSCETAFPDLEAILGMGNRDFKEQYGGTSAAWRGRNTLQRNAVIVLGNLKLEKYFNLLLQCLEDTRKEIRMHAMFSLLEYGEKGKALVATALEKEDEAFIKGFGCHRE